MTAAQLAHLVAEYEVGADIKTLAARWQLHRTTVAGHVRHAGVRLRRQAIRAEHHGCDGETVRQTLKRAGVGMRRPWERG